MVIRSNQLGLVPVETSTISGPSVSPSRAASASAMAGEVMLAGAMARIGTLADTALADMALILSGLDAPP